MTLKPEVEDQVRRLKSTIVTLPTDARIEIMKILTEDLCWACGNEYEHCHCND